MLALIDLTRLSQQHPYLFYGYLLLTTYKSFFSKTALQRSLNGVADLNHTICEVIARCLRDWRRLNKRFARCKGISFSGGTKAARKRPRRLELPLHQEPQKVQRPQLNGLL